MYDVILRELHKREKPIDVIVAGLGFMGFGFISSVRKQPGIRIPLIISRRPDDAVQTLRNQGIEAAKAGSVSEISEYANRGIIAVSANLDLVSIYPADVVMEVTGTVAYGTEVAIRAITAKKHLVTMNPELQVTVGTELKKLADAHHVGITDVIGDQPGSLARLLGQARLLGFKPLIVGNMKRYLDRHATQEKMKPWAEDKGLAVRQTVSFTDGTKQAIEMNLVSNYFGMGILKRGMHGPTVTKVEEALDVFPWENIPQEGVVDYVIGKTLFPGVFIVVEHTDPNQKKYLRYLGLGEGPRYLLFEPYHLCHLEVAGTIGKLVLFGAETINNSLKPRTTTITMAKRDLTAGTKLDGIGGDTVYGTIDVQLLEQYLPVGLAEGAELIRDVRQDEPITLKDVILPDTAATRLLGLSPKKSESFSASSSSVSL